MGQMTGRPGRSEVAAWPIDSRARGALKEYLVKTYEYRTKVGKSHTSDPIPVLEGAGLDFRGANLSRLDLTEADLVDANLAGVIMDDATLYGAWFHRVEASACSLRRARLQEAQFRKGQLSGAIFVGALLDDAEFYGASLANADFSETPIGDVWLQGADLRNANLRGCRLGEWSSGMALRGARLGGARVEHAHGLVEGPIDVGVTSSDVRDGQALTRWFAENGAPDVRVVSGI